MGAMGQMGTAGSREERQEAADRMQELRGDPRFRDQFRRLDERQQRAASEAGRGRDPLGAARNDILQDIRVAVRKTAEGSGGPTTEDPTGG